uniref:N-acyl-aliphatic-L-amino acid amidohydrolase n=1 Tax=Ditylenchus dipsaci TaxID=166011 RepID=A0A915DB75_9BILA
MTNPFEEHPAVSKFRQYLQINTEQPDPAYYDCKNFLLEYAKALELPSWSYECVAGKPIVGMTLEGTDPSLPSLFLWSHTDVTSTVPQDWTHPPFSAYKDNQGNIFARGAQDMKSIGIQYLEAIRQLRQTGKKSFLRTVHIVFGPDEEIGSYDGMEKYVHTQHFKDLNVGFALDEGLASPTNTYRVFIGQRCTWWFKVICPGNHGHGSRMLENTAGPKLASLLHSFSEFREKQWQLLEANPQLTLSDITSINLTKVEGGNLTNLIPSEFIAHFDLRVARKDSVDEVEAKLAEWCKKAGSDVTYEFKHKMVNQEVTSTSKDNPWWQAFSGALKEEKCDFDTEISVSGIDARYMREVGIPAIGFSPIINHPLVSGWHTHDEFLNETTFLRGIQLYMKIIHRLADVPKE